ncbi:MAG: DUF373 family protein [Thermoproteota archaeon]
MEEATRKALIVCVDMDDDVGRKIGLETPIVGREKVLRAAEKLILIDPEEADSNAMFASVKLSDDLSKTGYVTEVTVVGGLKDGGLEASKKVMGEILQIADSFKPSEVYVVTDGFGHEDIEPIIRARLPLAGIVRVIVKQSRAIEESYIIFGRYLKMLFTDPRFKKWVLGLGGLIITLLTLANHFSTYYRELNTILWVVVGLAIFMKGLDLDVYMSLALHRVWGRDLPPLILTFKTVLLFTGVSLTLFSLYQGVSMPYTGENFMAVIGRFIARAIDIMFFGIALILLSGTIRYPLDFSNMQDSLIMVASLLTLVPLIQILGFASFTPSLDLSVLLYTSILTLILLYATNVSIVLLMRLFSILLKKLKIPSKVKLV